MDARAKPAHDDSIQLDLGQGVFSSLAIGDRICLAGPFSPSAGVRVSIDLHGARAWWPERPAENEFSAAPCSVTQQLQDRLVALTQVLSSPPAEGLAPLLFGIDTPLARAAQPAAEHIADVIFRKTAPAQARIAPLLGLGPGLTPSGDDYLGGVLIALRTLGREDDADRIWSVIEPIVAAATNDISRAHLAAAAEGFGSAPLHVLLNAIIDGQSEWLADFAAAVIRIGHTSGWDALTGAIAALRATVADESYCAAST